MPVNIDGKVYTFAENVGRKAGDVYPFLGCFFADSVPNFLTGR